MSMSPDTRGRGQRLPRSARRAQLLEAAQEVFVESGYHAAAMDDIAERAGVSKPVLYQHFPGKLDLYLALLDQHSGELVAAGPRGAGLHHATTSSASPPRSRAYFDFVARDGAPFRLVFESDLTNEVAVRERVDKVVPGLRRGDRRGDQPRTPTCPRRRRHLLGMALSGMAQVCARFWLAQGSAIPRDEAARLVAALSWRGLGGFPKAERDGPAHRSAGPPDTPADPRRAGKDLPRLRVSLINSPSAAPARSTP